MRGMNRRGFKKEMQIIRHDFKRGYFNTYLPGLFEQKLF
jgi:hypothetical protein